MPALGTVAGYTSAGASSERSGTWALDVFIPMEDDTHYHKFLQGARRTRASIFARQRSKTQGRGGEHTLICSRGKTLNRLHIVSWLSLTYIQRPSL